MMHYRFVARTRAGERVSGSLEGPDRDAVIALLHGRALYVTAVERQRPWNTDLRFQLRFGGPSRRARVTFFRSFSTLLHAGISMRRALDVSIERTRDESLRSTLRQILGDIERGESLSSALRRDPRTFSELIVAMIAAGETGGILDDVLQRIATLLEHDERLRKDVVAAIAYPVTVLFASLILVVFLIVRIVPMFADLFASFHTELPASTRFLLGLGAAFGTPAPWIGLAAAIGIGLTALRVSRRTRAGALLLDRVRLALPLIGDLLRKTIHARFARMLGTLVHSGVELTHALDAVLPVMGSPVHAAALTAVSASLREGEALTPPLAATRVFDPMMVSLIGVGEETGMLDAMLEKAAEYFESDVAAAIATLSAVLEPALIVMLGVVVGFIVYSVYIPLYSLIGSISK
jgi:type IV pilus assembly protein PilC